MYFVEYLKISRICNANAVSRPGVRWSTIWFMGFQSQNWNKFFFISDQRLHRFKLRFQAFKNEMVETVQHGNGWNAPKIKNFLVGQRPKQRKHFRNVSIWNFKSSFCLPSNLNWRPDLVAGHFFTWNPASPSFLFPSSEHFSKRW